jgi:O-antigen ligase
MLVGVAGVVSTMSRGGFIGLLAMGAAIWLLGHKKIRSLIFIAVIAWGLVTFASDAYWTRMSTATEADEGTGKARVEMWKSAWAMFLDNPAGVGGGNFPVRFPEYQTDWFWHGEWGRPAHSVWFTVLPELGIPGVIVYGMLLFFNLRDSVRLRKIGRSVGGDDGALLVALGSAFLASFAGFFTSGTFLSVLYYPHYWYLTGFVVATSTLAAAARQNDAVPAAV